MDATYYQKALKSRQCADSVTVNPGETRIPDYYSTFSGSVTLMGHQVGWGPNSCDRVSGYVNFN